MKTEEEILKELELVKIQQEKLKNSDCNMFNACCFEICKGWIEALEWVLED